MFTAYDYEPYRLISHNVAKSVEKKLKWVNRLCPVIDADSLRNHLFPWWEPETIPKTDSEMVKLLSVPVVQRKLQEFGVGYPILTHGSAFIED